MTIGADFDSKRLMLGTKNSFLKHLPEHIIFCPTNDFVCAYCRRYFEGLRRLLGIADKRIVRRWEDGTQDIPGPVLLLMWLFTRPVLGPTIFKLAKSYWDME